MHAAITEVAHGETFGVSRYPIAGGRDRQQLAGSCLSFPAARADFQMIGGASPGTQLPTNGLLVVEALSRFGLAVPA